MSTVLHLLSAAGGGTERFVRDLAEGLPSVRHLLLQLGADEGAVLEDPVQGRHALLREVGVDRRRVLGLLDRYGVDLVHLHWISPATLPWMRELQAAGRPFVVSLHDIGFLRPAAFEAADPLVLDPKWVADWRPILETARAITSPSGFIDRQWSRLEVGRSPIRVAPGLADPTPLVEQALAEQPTVGIVGALGPHKGSDAVDALLPLAAATEMRFVLIGYQDRQLHPGSSHDGQLTVHGPYLPGEAPALIDRYRVDLVWFPNRMPESFSYALSEAWAAARPVLVPDVGALGERLHARGGGWLLQNPEDPALVLADLKSYLPLARSAAYRAELRRERAARIPTLGTMLGALQRLYDEVRIDPPDREPWADGELARQLAEQLGPLRFRHENIRLARDYAQARDWITHLERDLAHLQEARRDEQIALRVEVERRDDRVTELEQRLAMQAAECTALQTALTAPLEALRQQVEAQQQEISALGTAREQMLREHAATLDGLQMRIGELDESLLQARQQLSALWTERAALSIKAYRYDRVLGLLPAPLIRLARALSRRLRGGR